MVVVTAEQDTVVDVGAPSVLPRMEVVGLAPVGGHIAPVGATRAVTQRHGQALGRGEQPTRPTEVEGDAAPVQDRRHDVGGARETAGLRGGDAVAREVVAGNESCADETGAGMSDWRSVLTAPLAAPPSHPTSPPGEPG